MGLYSTLALAIVIVVGLFTHSRQDRAVIPYPVMKPVNEAVSIQWEPRIISASRSSMDPADHPGYLIAQQQCVRCHLFPEPSQLPHSTWPFVLTWMSNYLGYENYYGPFQPIVSGELIPDAALVSPDEFQAIAEYYLLYSTDSEKSAEMPTPKPQTRRFELTTPLPSTGHGELITLAHFDEATRRYFVGRAASRSLQIFEDGGNMIHEFDLGSEPVSLELNSSLLRIGTMGDFMTDIKGGRVVDIEFHAESPPTTNVVVANYPRLTQSISGDLDQDGFDDLQVIGFGSGEVGRASVFWGDSQGVSDDEQVLIDYAGALNAEWHDFNKDGLLDIMILTAQKNQELLLFLNSGRRQFQRSVVLKQFAGYGFNHLSVADFNGDGLMDLVLANGNNMEIKNAPLKPYHGLRILENTGNLTFAHRYFFPMHGALKAIAQDFDNDGDLDIAAIALYPDWFSESPETFAYLENLGDYRFEPSVLTNTNWNRWITMEAADVDSDGFKDLVLGGGYIRQGVHTDLQNEFRTKSATNPSIVVLKNTGLRSTAKTGDLKSQEALTASASSSPLQ